MTGPKPGKSIYFCSNHKFQLHKTLQMDHFKEDLASEDEFKGIADGALQAPADHLVKKFYTVIRESTKSHSRRPNQPKYTWSIYTTNPA